MKNTIDFDLDFDVFSRASTCYMGMSLINRMKDPSFVVEKAEIAREGRDELVRVDYKLDDALSREAGAVYLDPGLNWAIRKLDYTNQPKKLTRRMKLPPPSRITSDIEYRKIGNDTFYPCKISNYVRTSGTQNYQSDLIVYDEIKIENVPDQIFRMTYYGLPDLPLKSAQKATSSSLRNPLIWGPLIMIIVSLAVLRMTRSKDQRTSASSGPR